MRFELIDGEATDALPAMVESLRLYNRENNPVFYAVRDLPANAVRHFHIVLHDDEGKIAGGVIAESQFSWLKIEIVSVRLDLRGRGIGRELVRQAEEEGVRRGCKYVFLDTMSYQAPGFYQKLGYSIAGRIEDWDSHGNTKFFMTKKL